MVRERIPQLRFVVRARASVGGIGDLPLNVWGRQALKHWIMDLSCLHTYQGRLTCLYLLQAHLLRCWSVSGDTVPEGCVCVAVGGS